MPYRDKEKQKEAVKKAVDRHRKGITEEGITSGYYKEMFEGKPRFITLSDGQIFDRTYQPAPNKHLRGMIGCNRADKIDLARGISKAKRLALLLTSLDRNIAGLGKSENMLDQVRYGVRGPTLKEIKASLT